MKRPLLLLTLLAMSSSLFAAGAVPGFHTDYDTALAEAKKLDKPLYIHFTTDWCSWCRKIENDIYKKAKGKAALKPFVAVSLNCTEGEPKVAAYKTLMKKYGEVFDTFAGILKSKVFGKQPALAALCYVALENPDQMKRLEEFAQQYNDGLNISSSNSPVAKIRHFATEAAKALSTHDRRTLFLKTVSAARLAMKGENIKKLFGATPETIHVSSIQPRKL